MHLANQNQMKTRLKTEYLSISSILRSQKPVQHRVRLMISNANQGRRGTRFIPASLPEKVEDTVAAQYSPKGCRWKLIFEPCTGNKKKGSFVCLRRVCVCGCELRAPLALAIYRLLEVVPLSELALTAMGKG